jgi:hypothetical protein
MTKDEHGTIFVARAYIDQYSGFKPVETLDEQTKWKIYDLIATKMNAITQEALKQLGLGDYRN